MNTTLRHKFSQYWNTVQEELIPQINDELGPLTVALLAVIRTLECGRIEEFVERRWCGIGRPPKDRLALARAFVAKSVLHLPTTEALRERLHIDRPLQRICGFDTRKALPDASTFSRAFTEMTKGRVGERCHQALIEATLGDQLIGHITRDATAIEARERPVCHRKHKKAKVIDLTLPPAQAHACCERTGRRHATGHPHQQATSWSSGKRRNPPGATGTTSATTTQANLGTDVGRVATAMRSRQQV